MKRTAFYWAALIVCLLPLTALPEAQAARSFFDPEVENLINLAFFDFISGAQLMEDKLTAAASKIFWGLCVIGLVFKGVELLFKEDGGIQSFFGSLVQMIIIIGIFEFLLKHGPQIGVAVIQSLMQIPSGGTDSVTPVRIFNEAMAICEELSKAKGGGGLAEELMVLFLQCFVIILLFLCTINFAILYMCAYIMCVAGIVALGFGAFVYTRGIAVNYLRMLLSLGLQLMVMILVCLTGLKSVAHMHEWVVNTDNIYSLTDMLIMLFVVMLFYAMTRALPGMAGALVMGGSVSVNEGRSGFFQAAGIAWAPIAATTAFLYRKITK